MQSKLSAPTPPAGWIERGFVDAGPPVQVLAAGPGYGKTLGLLALWSPAPMRLWYGLESDDADVATFFHHLVAGMRVHIPDFGEEILALVAASKLDAKLLWQRFFQAVAAYNLPGLALALDDAHHLAEGDAEILQGLGAILGKLPPGVQVLIASRKRLPIPLARLQAQGQARVLGPEQLRFSPAETQLLLQRRAGDGPIPEPWKRQAEALEGWPLGLDLVVAGVGASLAPGTEVLSEFIAEELYGVQPAARRAFMVRAALLHEPSAEALQELLPGQDVELHLAALEADQLVGRVARASHGAKVGGAPEARYRFPGYLADFLRQEARRSVPGAELADLHRRAGAYYRLRELDELALPHLIAAGEWPEAVAACTRSFPTMSTYGRKAAIQRLIASFPADVVKQEPYLLLWQGNAMVRAFDLGGAREAYEQVRKLYQARGDGAGDLKAIVRMINVAVWTGDEAGVAALTADALKLLPGGLPEDVADFHLARALVAEGNGDPKGMREHNEAVLGVPVEASVEVAACRVIALINLTTWGLQHGALERAEGTVREALALAEQWRFYGNHRLGTFMRALLHLIQGQPEGVAMLQQLPPFWEDALSFIELGVALTIQAYALQAQGEPKAAEEVLRKSLVLFERSGYLDARKVPLERLLWVALQRAQPARVEGLIDEYAPGGGAPGASLHDLALRVPLGRALHQLGRSAEAVTELEAAITGFDRLEARLEAARARLYLAAALGEPARAREVLQAANDAIAAHGFAFLREQDAGLWEELRRLDAVEAPPTAGLLSITCLGPMEVRKDGVLIDTWPRRKAKVVLAALAIYRRGVDAMDLAEIVSQGEVSSGTMHSLQMSVSALRKVLEPDLKGTSAYVSLKDDRYLLDWGKLESLDLTAFDQAYDEGMGLRQGKPFDAAEAFEKGLAHARGPLLSDGMFAGSFESERQHYRTRALDALLWLGGHYGSLMQNAKAESAFGRAVALAPTDEDTYLAFMRHFRANGRADRIRQLYWDCRKAMKAQLGLAPSPAFEDAYKAMGAF
ncbi:MAG: transcriptional regulator [Cyanobacteria bacterium RYN_339]|nr:transcriptional regulator [Cyanobacteria bacterium RYN_339]